MAGVLQASSPCNDRTTARTAAQEDMEDQDQRTAAEGLPPRGATDGACRSRMQAWHLAETGQARMRRWHLDEVELAIGCGLSEIGGQVSDAAVLEFVGESYSDQYAQESREADLHRHGGGVCRPIPIAVRGSSTV